MMMREEMRIEITRRDEALFSAAERTCPSCGSRLYSHGKTNDMGYLTIFGEVRIRLRRLHCTSCGQIIIPGQVLIPENNISAPLAERMCDLASKTPYAKAADSLFIQQGITMSPKCFWTHVQKEASFIDDVLEAEAKALFEDGIAPEEIDLKGEKPLIIGIDGGHVRGWKNNPSFEVKCATIATGSAASPGKHRHLKDRVGYAANCSVEEFRKRISVLALKSGYRSASMRIFVSDGASWIATMIENYFPDAIHILDMFHLKRKVEGLFGIKAEGIYADIRDAALKACNTFDPDLITEILKNFGPTDESKAKDKAELIEYIENNATAIRNHKLTNIHGSGWIEKGVDLMISRRMKNRGMAWTLPGSSHIIPFAVLRYNNQWNSYWSQRKGLCDMAAA